MSRTIKELAPGTGIWLDEWSGGVATHTPYIFLGLDESGNARLRRKYATIQKRMHSSNVASYAGCEADLWLENESTGFLSRFDKDTLDAIVPTEIKYRDFNQNTEGTATVLTIARRCFLLSGSEEGFYSNPDEGKSYLSALLTYYGTTNANTARITRNTSEDAVYAWCRSAYSAVYFVIVSANGYQYSYDAAYTGYWLCPALSVSSDTIVSPEGADEIWLLPDTRTTKWLVDAVAYPGQSEKRPKAIKPIVDVDGADAVTIEVSNNAKDAAPVWVAAESGKSVTVNNTAKETENWEVGVKIYAEFPTHHGYVYEPVAIVAVEKGDV